MTCTYPDHGWDKNKLRRCNQSRSPNQLILWSNCLLIDFFDPNLSSDSKLLRQNWFQWLKKIKNLKIDWNKSKRDRIISKMIEKVKINQLFWYKYTISIFYSIFSIFYSTKVNLFIKITSKLWLLTWLSTWNRIRIVIDDQIWRAWNMNCRRFDS